MSSPISGTALRAGAAVVDITPKESVFLFGYPHVPRWSTGVHDPLEASALYLEQGATRLLIIANDIIFVPKTLVTRVRARIMAATGVPAANIAITATHTHSGPLTADHLSNAADSVVPKTDPKYLEFIEERIVDAGVRAVRNAGPAEIALATARAQGVGTNRHDPAGPADPDVPVVMVRRPGGAVIGCMVAYAMHTTVLHEDSKLISGDFPYFTKKFLKDIGIVPADGVVVYHQGASGNQSPRHVTKANTFAEAQRLGELLGAQIAEAIKPAKYSATTALKCTSSGLELSLRNFPKVAEAKRAAEQAKQRYDQLRTTGAPRTEVRTAECDVFGAEETVSLASAFEQGEMTAAANACLPAEIQVMQIGSYSFVFWPGEFFVEYALKVKAAVPDTFVVTLANGELQGYVATEEADRAGFYEARNAIFDARNGDRVVHSTLALLTKVR